MDKSFDIIALLNCGGFPETLSILDCNQCRITLYNAWRCAAIIKQKNKKLLIFGVNNGAARVFAY